MFQQPRGHYNTGMPSESTSPAGGANDSAENYADDPMRVEEGRTSDGTRRLLYFTFPRTTDRDRAPSDAASTTISNAATTIAQGVDEGAEG